MMSRFTMFVVVATLLGYSALGVARSTDVWNEAKSAEEWSEITAHHSTAAQCQPAMRPISQNPCLNLQHIPSVIIRRSKLCKAGDMLQCSERGCSNSCDCKKTQKPYYPIEEYLWTRHMTIFNTEQVTGYRVKAVVDKTMTGGDSLCIKGDEWGFGFSAPSFCCDYVPVGGNCTEYGACGPTNYCNFEHMMSNSGSCRSCPKYDDSGNDCAESKGMCQNCALDGSVVMCGKSLVTQAVCNGQVMAAKMTKFLECMYPEKDCFGIAIGQLITSRCLLNGKCNLEFGYPHCLRFDDMVDGLLGTKGGHVSFKESLNSVTLAGQMYVSGGIQVAASFGPAIKSPLLSFTLKQAAVTIDLEADFKYSKKASQQDKQRVELAEALQLALKTGFVGVVPVVVEIKLTPVAEIEWAASASGTFEFGYRYKKVWSIKDGSKLWFDQTGLHNNFELAEVESVAPQYDNYMDISASASASLKLVIGPELTVTINSFPITALLGVLSCLVALVDIEPFLNRGCDRCILEPARQRKCCSREELCRQ